MNRYAKILTSLSLAVLLTACSLGPPKGIEPVQNFAVEPYLGTWYEVARLDHSFEEGLSDVTATYSMREDGGVKVVNRGYSEEEQQWDEAEGKAYFVEGSDVGHLKVSFFGPFYGAYVIFSLDDDYQTALVAGPDRSYFWLLSRTPEIDSEQMQSLLQKAEQQGFDTSKLIYVEHSRATF
ncbi:lipocalin family protein [Marinomonas ostreistagni]|uniref:lipocalin family protein n=1 Tax=Marinomonas ostreistagni TaxID=359209 RepID=UPI0019526A2C|nr:lipocalin family protein [Marinomonas ostreistagni]MBM6551882.1 lipocalin family protein [Marinomonas ostreistagni]